MKGRRKRILTAIKSAAHIRRRTMSESSWSDAATHGRRVFPIHGVVSGTLLSCFHYFPISSILLPFLHGLIMAAEGKAIIFYRCNLFFCYFVSIYERPAIGSQPNLASRSEVVSIYKCPQNFTGTPQIWGAKNVTFWTTFSRLSHMTPHISGMKRRIDKPKF